MTDDLYLGYYIHIVEDVYYRYFIHTDKGIPRAAIPELREVIYRDYRLLNGYIEKKYDLERNVTKPEGFEKEAINSLYPFDADKMLSDLAGDYADNTQGVPVYHTPEILDEFVDIYFPKCEAVLCSARRGDAPPDPLEYKWSAGDRKDYL